jgi:formate hydrogenlyase subunit 3/multisubunit Na+/H+ antiporter MnhD subunit
MNRALVFLLCIVGLLVLIYSHQYRGEAYLSALPWLQK